MTPLNDKAFIQEAFQKLIARGVIRADEISPSVATDTDIAAYEKKFQVTLPSFFKAFLKSYSYHFTTIAAPVPEDITSNTIQTGMEGGSCDMHLLWLELNPIPQEKPLENLYRKMEDFRGSIISGHKLLGVTLDDMKNFVPVGDWGAGWGSLLIDLNKPDEAVDINNENTWNLVWFDHEDYPWKEPHVEPVDIPVISGAGFTMSMGHFDSCRHAGNSAQKTTPTLSEIERSDKLRYHIAAPDFKTLLEWYFCGKFDKIYEMQRKAAGKKIPDYSKFVNR